MHLCSSFDVPLHLRSTSITRTHGVRILARTLKCARLPANRPLRALAMSDWKKLIADGAREDKAMPVTSEPLDLYVVVSDKAPMGLGTKRFVNPTLLARIKKVQSPRDNYTFVFSWYKKGKMWAHLKSKTNPGYCTMRQLLADEDFLDMWNDESIISGIIYVKDTIDGPAISEEEALDLNDAFDPDAEPPQTAQAPRRRAAYDPATSASDSGSSSGSAKRSRRWSKPARSPAQPAQPALLAPWQMRARWRKQLQMRGLHSITARRISGAYYKYLNSYLRFNRNLLYSDLPLPDLLAFADHYMLMDYKRYVLITYLGVK